MISLLSSVSITELFIILCMFALALKEFISIIDFFWVKLKAIFMKEQTEEDKVKKIQEKIDKIEKWQVEHEQTTLDIKIDYNGAIEELKEQLEKQQKTLDTLVASDRDDIKGWLVQQYHYFMNLGSIDDFSKDTIEKRATHYFTEGGNSYIEDLLKQIRKLPPS